MKRIIGPLLGALLAVGLLFGLIAPASAVSDAVTCTGGTNVTGSVTALQKVGDPDRITVTGIINDTANRTWTWRFYHNGDLSAGPGTRSGDATITTTMLDFGGTDVIKFTFVNDNGVISCSGTVNYNG